VVPRFLADATRPESFGRAKGKNIARLAALSTPRLRLSTKQCGVYCSQVTKPKIWISRAIVRQIHLGGGNWLRVETLSADLSVASAPRGATSHLSEVLAAAGYAQQAALHNAEATEIEAMASQIIPSNSTPGARSRRYLFHRPRARNFRSREARSLQERPSGPAEEDGGPPIQHWNVLRAIIDAPRQIELLKNIEKTEFFEQVRLHTIMGFLANPEYGGNRDRIGWKLMALETASSTSRPSASTTATTTPKRTDRGRDGDENPEI